jgi:transcription antitermination factor NusG
MESALISAPCDQPRLSLPASFPVDAESCETRWYAAYTRANHEKRVAQQLERRCVEHFLPLYESVRRWKDRRVRLQMPLFPGYVFVRMALREKLRVLEIPGVARLVGFDGNPTAIPAEDMEAVRACVNGGHAVEPYRYIRRGQRVRVLSGSLAGFSGIVVRQKNRARLVVSFDVLERSVAVELDGAEVMAQ